MSKVNWKAVEKWRDALRSGKYKQGRGRMYMDGRFCCLGVFQSGVQGRDPDTFMDDYELDKIGTEELGSWLENPSIFGLYASALNDDEWLTFDEIADLLTIALIEREGIE
jgi:hypothetical protein